MSYLKDPLYFLRDIAEKTGLEEKEEGIRRVVFSLCYLNPASTKEISRFARLPVPITAAVRKEFENSGVLQRATGLELTGKGIEIANALFSTGRAELIPDRKKIEDIKKEISEALAERPQADRTLDQSYSTIETQVRRVSHMLLDDAVLGRDISILGDDDMTSLSLCIYLECILPDNTIPCRIRVYECDDRLIQYIASRAKKRKYPVKVNHADLISRLKPSYLDISDTVFTDPPYTVKGVELFLSRAVEMLKWGSGRKIYLSLPRIRRGDLLKIQKDIAGMDLLTECILRDFNKYQGNSIYGNHSDLYCLSTCQTTRSKYKEDSEGNIYTFDANPKVRAYQCKKCQRIFKTGTGGESIDLLISRGCDNCGSKQFDRIDARNP